MLVGLALPLIILLTSNASVSALDADNVICVRPSEPPDIHCNCLSTDCNLSYNCHTLNDWIKSSQISNRNVTVKLLSGVHQLNLTRERQLEHSVTLPGNQNHDEPTLIFCIRSKIHLSSGHSLKIRNITFHGCTVALSFVSNVAVKGVTMIDGRLVVDYQMLDFHFTPFDRQQENNLNLKTSCEHQQSVDILESSFQNSTVLVQGSTDVLMDDYLYTSCVDVHVRKIQIENVSNNEKAWTVSFYHAYSVTLSDIVLRNNSSPLLHLFVTNFITFEGCISFSWNHGRGINISVMGSLNIKSDTELKFTGNEVSGHLLYISYNVEDSRRGRVQPLDFRSSVIAFERNKVEKGSIMVLDNVYLTVNRMSFTFENNTSLIAGAQQIYVPTTIFLLKATQVVLHNSKLSFVGNSAAMLSGGLTFSASTCRIKNITAVFDYNSGIDGGALAFYGNSHVEIENTDWEFEGVQTNVFFRFNRAQTRGGAIFVDDSDYTDVLTTQYYDHFIQMPSLKYIPQERTNISVNFTNNIAEVAGDDIYGGWIDTNLAISGPQWSRINLTGHPPQMGSMYAVTSDPIRVCICIQSFPVCNITEYQVEVFPGQSFEIEAVAVGQRMGIVPSIVTVSFTDGEGRLGDGEDVQSAGKECTTLKFTVYTSKKKKSLELSVKNSAIPNFSNTFSLLYQEINFTIRIEDCPLGYVFEDELLNCQCLRQIEQLGAECNYETFTVSRNKQQWLSPTTEHVIGQNYGVIVHDRCPYDYCRTDPDSLSFHLEFPDDQCAFNHSGVLCGACQANLSQMLGSSKCAQCSNIMLIAVIPTSIIAGVLLVIFLMLFNLTVSVGTISGLIFYANVIRSNQAIFFPPEFSTQFLRTFIAWLNLDLGIETCLYDGLNAYAKTWLQFAFPCTLYLVTGHCHHSCQPLLYNGV